MKKAILLVFLLAAGMAFAQTKNLGDFDQLKVFDRITVNLVPSETAKIELVGKRSSDVEVVNKNGLLKIRMKLGKLLDGENVTATLYYKELNDIDASEGSLITNSTALKSPKMTVTAKEGAQIELNLDVQNVDVKSVTGAVVRLAGTAKRMEASLGTGGVLEAKTLKTEQTEISINAGGEAEVNATELVDASIKAGGNVTVFGHPKQIDKDIKLGGSVEESKN